MITLDQYLKQSGTEEKVTITAMNEIIRDRGIRVLKYGDSVKYGKVA